jgi:DNA-binding transcriptional LysR family regulator
LLNHQVADEIGEKQMKGIGKSTPPESLRLKADWTDLHVFWAVAEAGSFTEAAARLGMTQPTTSNRVRELEGRLGVQLFHRAPQRVTLTEAGQAIHDHVTTMRRSAEAVERLALNKDSREEGRVIIAVPDGLATYVLVPEIADFIDANPKISLDLDCGLWSEFNAPMPRTDIALQFEPVTNPDVITTPIGYYHYCLFASRRYLDLHGTPKSLQEAAAHRFVHHFAYSRQPENWGAQTAALQGLLSVSIGTNCSPAIVEAVRCGVGIGPLPSVVASFAPDLVMLDIKPLARLELRICVHRDLADAKRIRLVTDWLKGVFDPRTKPWFRAEFVHPSAFSQIAQGANGAASPEPARRSAARPRAT